MPTATLSSKSQLVLPAEIRRKLGIHPGDQLTVELEGDHAVIRKAPRSDVEALAAYRSNVWRDYADEVQTGRDEWDQ
ncbi:MAG: AbrB/MazE/SpoVT family DNA-binding domain-containing protein [Gammaproteobacteria bacterium]|nr:AbrB/MazE/SpoVT family DNA-binding domain-containing protein [Gammaproteobacteria bacterium]HXK57744.1 AbrB/MazE/SpoVT family DNA-binding domain-containing protein [Gammaproteobacteria bacterium]